MDGDETPEGHALRYDKNGDLVGITIVGARRLVDKDRDVHVQAPVTLPADALAQVIRQGEKTPAAVCDSSLRR